METTMLWDAITNPLFWFGSAIFFIVIFFGILAAYSFRKRDPYHYVVKTDDNIQSDDGSWTPTGRIDFIDPRSSGHFILQVEDTRIVESMSGVDLREIRWRNATLDEAKVVVVTYHAHRNLTMRSNFSVTSANRIQREFDLGQTDSQLENNEAPEGPVES
jgi:hypothetical protein